MENIFVTFYTVELILKIMVHKGCYNMIYYDIIYDDNHNIR